MLSKYNLFLKMCWLVNFQRVEGFIFKSLKKYVLFQIYTVTVICIYYIYIFPDGIT